MQKIKALTYATLISHPFDVGVDIGQEGIYLIQITASAQAWWQHIVSPRSFFKKDSLTILLDDDDIQIRIDGAIEKNEEKRAHRDWFWCGKILKGASKTFERSFFLYSRSIQGKANSNG